MPLSTPKLNITCSGTSGSYIFSTLSQIFSVVEPISINFYKLRNNENE